MTRDQRRQLVTGAISCLALALILAGPPVFLAAAVGWPLPTTIPSLDEIRTAITIGIQNDVIVKGLALVAWAAWALLASSIVAEIVARIRGRAARVLPGMPDRIQAGVGRLVASATLAVTTLGPLAAAGQPVAAAPAITLAAVHPTHATVPVATQSSPAPTGLLVPTPPDEGPPAQPDARTRPTLVARRHDSYWAIAERSLGDPLRWSEIRDLNAGRTMPDGTVIPPSSDHPLPGWQLVLPADAQTSASPAAGMPAPEPVEDAPTADPIEVTVQPGDNMWQLAENDLAMAGQPIDPADVVPFWLRFIDANRTRLADTDNPSLIYPGETLVFPTPEPEPPTTEPQAIAAPGPPSVSPRCDPPSDSTTPASAAIEAPTSETSTTDTARPTDVDAEARPAPATQVQDDHDDSGPTAPSPATLALTGLVTTVLATGVVEGIRRRRRRSMHQHQQAAPGPSVNPPLHQALAVQADGNSLQRLRYALGQLAQGIAAKGHVCRPRIVQQGADHLDVLLDRPTLRPPDGWDADAEGRIWTRTADGMAADRCGTLRSDHLDPTPLLVALGAADDSGQLYLDLEAASVIALTGDRDTALGIARSFVAELANSPMAEAAQISVIGDLGGHLERLDRVTVHQDWSRSAAADLEAWADGTREAIADAGWPNGFIGRSRGVWADALGPLIVVAAAPPDESSVLDDLLAAGPASAAVVLVGDAPNGALTIDCRTDQLELPQLGLTCQPRPVTAELLDGVVDLLDQAAGRLDPDTSSDTPNQNLMLNDAAPPGDSQTGVPSRVTPDESCADPNEAADRPYEDPPYDVLVRVLGDIEVEGSKVPPTPKQTAILSYLALHGSTDGDRLAEALWATSPGTGAHRKRLGNAIGECRRILESNHLPPAADGRYELGPAVLTDTELWDQRVKAAASQPPDVAAEILHGAIALVRGPVFAYRNTNQDSYAWIDIENLVAIWEKKITSVTQHLAELYLDLGQPERAIAVAEQILRAVPTDTAVTETLMRAHAANSDLRSLKRVYQAHVNALERLDLDQPAESTTALFDDLRHTTTGDADGM
jgi:DNA-binding SARP family transcriptional activator/nucleoid-associated protein YgaU